MKRFLILIISTILLLSSCQSSVNETSSLSKEEHDLINVMFEAEQGGYLIGSVNQVLRSKDTSSSVTAVPNICYEFESWSDGVKTPTRSGEIFSEDTKLKAVFKYIGLPEIYINYQDETIHKTYPINAKFTVKNVLSNYEMSSREGTIQGRGNSTWDHEKKPYKIKFNESVNLLGIGNEAYRDWVLLSNHCDQTLIRNYYAYNLAYRLGIGYKSTLVEIYLNGKYNGVYLLTGRVEDARHDIDTDKGGFLIELDKYYEGENDVDYFSVEDEHYTIHSDLTKNQIKNIKNYMKVVTSAIVRGDEETIRKYIDVDSFVDMYILQEYVKNIDAGWSSFYLYKKDGTDKLRMGPAWDFDIAMGNDFRLDGGGYDGIYVGRESGIIQQMWWFIHLCRTEWFRELVTERWNSTFKTLSLKVLEETTSYVKLNAGELEKNFDRWNNVFGTRINCEPDHIIGFNTYEKHYSFFESWMKERRAWVDKCFNNKRLWRKEIENRRDPTYTHGKLPEIK